ncbi:MAG TPA: hypothetical protein VH117_08070 [Edaphobacter sp.]|jgi:hypothetical protein|nr:hypothetical protein [Edaphobacter sp.]
MSVMPIVHASLAERFIFNFRLPAKMLATYLPLPWLTPQEVHGYGIASFCILDLRGITVAPLTTTIGLSSISCAPRYAVLDLSCGQATPAVFVTERQTNSAFGAWFTSLGFSAPHPQVEAVIDHQDERTLLRVDSSDDGLLFAATVRPSTETNSELFPSQQEFADFIAQGVSSYGRSRHGSRLTKVDLQKDDGEYTPLEISNLDGAFVDDWQRHGGVFDSGFRTRGGRYEWTYRGLTDEVSQ